MTILKKKYKKILFVLFPNLRQVEVGVVTARKVYGFVKSRKKKNTMRFPIKLAVASACAFVFIILVGFVMFPKMIKGKIKEMVNLEPGNDIREMFLKVPFPLTFNVYIFSAQNPEEIQKGGIPKLKEIGPFCHAEYKKRVNVEDSEADDTITYQTVDTFFRIKGPGCKDPDTEVTLPHPMILSIVNTIARQKPGAMTLANKAIKSIWSNPDSLFITVKARELLFDGIVIHCNVTDFAGKAICSNLNAEPSLEHIGESDLAFSFLGFKNATPGKQIIASRGGKNFQQVGKILKYDGKTKQEIWNNSKCDAIFGTDGTIFPPFLKKEEGLSSFAPDLCRSMTTVYERQDKYDGIPVNVYSASLGDQSKNPDEKCFCTTPTTCSKKGVIDLYKCAKVPLYASLPHFYDSHESYLKAVKGLKPEADKHAITIFFESMTGSPLSAKKRMQFSMPLEANPKVELFHNFTRTIFPLFWVEEGVDLNNTYTKPLKSLFLIQNIFGVIKYVVLLGSIAGFATSAYLYYKTDDSINITSVKKVQPDQDGTISTILNGNSLQGRLNNGFTGKY